MEEEEERAAEEEPPLSGVEVEAVLPSPPFPLVSIIILPLLGSICKLIILIFD